jgi:hypothetical protein
LFFRRHLEPKGLAHSPLLQQDIFPFACAHARVCPLSCAAADNGQNLHAFRNEIVPWHSLRPASFLEIVRGRCHNAQEMTKTELQLALAEAIQGGKGHGSRSKEVFSAWDGGYPRELKARLRHEKPQIRAKSGCGLSPCVVPSNVAPFAPA